MRIDVAFAPAGLAGGEVAGRTVFVIDVLRASTTICAALARGARGIIPVPSIEEAMRLAQTLERREVLLAGERIRLRRAMAFLVSLALRSCVKSNPASAESAIALPRIEKGRNSPHWRLGGGKHRKPGWSR